MTKIQVIQNYVDGDPTSGNPSDDVITTSGYDGGLLSTVTVQSGYTTETTKYVYGTGTSDSSPAVYRNDLLRAVIYADSADTYDAATQTLHDGSTEFLGQFCDRVEYTYDRQGEVTELKDQNETVHNYSYDNLGRQISDSVTLPSGNPAGIDTSVLRIEDAYNVRGQLETATSLSAATGGDVVNQVQYAYNDAGLVSREYQEHDGAVDQSTLYTQYDYAGADKGYRPTAVEYPNGRTIHYTYGATGSADDNLNRLATISDDDGYGNPGQVLAAYSYLGLGTIVTEDYQQPELKLDYTGGGDSYTGLDRFNRVVDQLWRDYGSSTNAEEYTYGYDLSGDVAWKENVAAGSHNLDELYTYNDEGQLTSVTRGQLSSAHDAILTGTTDFVQDWTLDGYGNWDGFLSDTDGNGIWDASHGGGFNGANEISNVTGCVTPVYDRAGNMTAGPAPDAASTKIHLVYDAWNRLVAVKADALGQPGATIAQYQYDAVGRLIVRAADTDQDGTLDTFTHYFYAGEQVVETRDAISSSAEPENLQPSYQYVYSIRNVDAPILRDTYVGGDLSAEDRVYYLTDANNNVTALADASGNVIERYVYTPYGSVTVYDATWSNVRSSSAYANCVLFGGMSLDPLTGFYGDRARWYHPGLGTFVSRDPLGLSAGPNMYAYTGDNPIDRSDPSGLYGVQLDGMGDDSGPGVWGTLTTGYHLNWHGYEVFVPNDAVIVTDTWNVCCYNLDEPDWGIVWGGAFGVGEFNPVTEQWRVLTTVVYGITEGISTYAAAAGPARDWVDQVDRFFAGFADTWTFGISTWLRGILYGGVATRNHHGAMFTAGQWVATVDTVVIGGAAGWSRAGVKGTGREFSHWIPNRLGGPRSLWNGNFVTRDVHALSDPFRYRFMPRLWKATNPLPGAVSRQWNRIPYVYKGIGIGGLYGGGSAALGGENPQE